MMRNVLSIVLIFIVFQSYNGEIIEIDSVEIDLDAWWGPGEQKDVDSSIREFKIEFTDQMIEDLRCRIRSRRRPYPPRIEDTTFEDGFNTDQLDSWMDFWSEEYAFKEQQDFLNEQPQYLVNVGGLDVHFIWKRARNPAGKRVIPLLMLHGFPGSVREFYEIIPLLTAEDDTRDFVFDLVVPSLPGFGFSQAAVKPGLDSVAVAVLFRRLMITLGYDKYFVHGGDWGAIIASHIATIFHTEVLGYHTNFALAFTTPTFLTWGLGSLDPDSVADPSVQDQMYPLTNLTQKLIKNAGYFLFQSTKPDTLSVGVSDSPAGLLTYILSLFVVGTRGANSLLSDGGLDKYYTRTQLVDNLMFYWTPNSFATATRLYLESMRPSSLTYQINGIPTSTPTWTVSAPDEILYMSESLLEYKYTHIVNATMLSEGGHFLALEKPEVLAEDIFKTASEFLALDKVLGKCQCEL